MIITDYHVQSVLRTHVRQLQRSRFPIESLVDEGPMSLEKLTISEEAKQQLLLERIKSQALEKADQLKADVAA